MPAATVNNYGKGKAYYMAFRDKRKDFIRALTNLALDEAGVAPCMNITLPDGCTAHVREADGVGYYFVECYDPKGAHIDLDGEYYSMLDEKNVTALDFDGVGVAVLKK
jgi:beta-galactosidase